MIIKIDKSFEKDTNKIKDRKLLNLIADFLETAKSAKSINELKQLKKLKGFNTQYRIKLNDYRIGLIIENNVLEFVRFLHRKDIYKYFPK